MRCWQVRAPGPIDSGPLEFTTAARPEAAAGELLIQVLACGVCRTDLHVAEGDLPVHRRGVIPGHEIVGEVVDVGPGDDTAAGPGADPAGGRTPFAVGDRVGVAWLRHTCGSCRYCRRGNENLCPYSRYTGWDADGGYAEYALVPAAYALPLPPGYNDIDTAPLLCAGIIGYRALRRAALPAGGRLGLYGFGGSAHIAAQVAIAEGAEVHVMTRDPAARELALELGAASAQDSMDTPPVPLDSAILFAPVGALVPPALTALDSGGVLAIAGIHLSDVPALNYQRHLFREREIRSVTANTRDDAHEFLAVAGRHGIRLTTHPYPLDAADRALGDLAHGRFAGAAVLVA
ncbi:zinc-binding alcohol dehydrogenase family protein [Nocardia cyriacigeorgica]|uniref:zinc-binding alcohol dehydrogenase family protein n=1 Tax=Nocardia cyriacigeorgica TaxID=135487 RepID=UPI001896322A|nr:zinc-binding alcohol dehydrogenase family protein [Nocardia cyriacigeorgica]MBF6416068.1 zinc-binding alcohol dehydrogenase family protein [Nocardia cyriacigeorgica]